MKLGRTYPRIRRGFEHGFTMIEIAISLAIVAFALVAILGVLPTGMTVQKENREDTHMKVDGLYFLDGIRNGARGLQDLTNYVEEVRVELKLNGATISDLTYTNLNAEQIIGVLTTPKYPMGLASPLMFNRVTARVRGMSGSTSEKTTREHDIAFRYEIESEVIPVISSNYESTNVFWQRYTNSIQANLHDVRLTVRWPMIEKGVDKWSLGPNRKTLAAQVAGKITQTNYPTILLPGYFFELNQYANAPGN